MLNNIRCCCHLLLHFGFIVAVSSLCAPGTYLNLCGFCTGGASDSSGREGLDPCGVCDGQSDCVGCDGVINSPRRRDSCGMCLSPEAPTWNDCRKIDGVYPSVLDLALDDRLVSLTVVGAGLKRSAINGTQCRLLPTESQINEPTVKEVSMEEDDIQIKLLLTDSTGKFRFECTGIEGSAELRVVDSRQLDVHLAEPSAVNVDEAVQIELQVEEGNSGNADGNYWCFVRTKGMDTRILNAVRISRKRFRCSEYLPSSPERLHLGLVAHEDSARYEKGTGRTAEVLVRGKPVRGVTAEYSSDMSQLSIRFDQNIDVTDCRRILSPTAERLLGRGFSCFAAGDTLTFELGDGARLMDQVELIDSRSIKRARTETDPAPGTSAVVLPVSKDKVISPVFGLTVPNGICEDEETQPTVSVMVSRLGRQNAKYTWSLPPIRSGRNQRENLLMWQRMRAMEREVNNASGADAFLLHRTKLLPGYEYDIHLGVGDGGRESASVRILKAEAASVTLSTFPSGTAITAEAKVTLCTKTAGEDFRFEWEIDGKAVSNEGRLLKVEKRNPGLYNVSCSVTRYRSADVLGTAWAIAKIVSLPPRVVIFPEETVAGTMDEIRLRAIVSPGRFRGRWLCRTRGEECIVVGRSPLKVQQVVNVNKSTLFIPAGTLSVGRYTWSLSGFPEPKATVIVKSRIPPKVSVKPPPTGVDPNAPLFMNAEVGRLKPGCRIRWVTNYKKGFDFFDLQEDVGLGDAVQVRVEEFIGEMDAPLVVPAPEGKWRGLNGDGTYSFRLEVLCPHPVPEAHADVIVSVNAPPRGAPLEVSPEVGLALGKFSVRVPDSWDSVQDYPLTYRLSYVDGFEEEVPVMESIFTIFETILPPGNVTVIVKACDVRNSCSSSTKVVAVHPPSNVSSRVIQNINREIRNLMLSGDTTAAYGLVITAMKSLSSGKGFKEKLEQVSSGAMAVIRERLKDLTERLDGGRKVVASGAKFLEETVFALKYLPEGKDLVGALAELKNLIVNSVEGKRPKREAGEAPEESGTPESLVRAIFHLHSKNIHPKSARFEIMMDVTKYTADLCRGNKRSYIVASPSVSFRVEKLLQWEKYKKFHMADERTAVLTIINSTSIRPNSCLITVRYPRELISDYEGSDVYEVRIIPEGNARNGKMSVTLPTPAGNWRGGCMMWRGRWEPNCKVTHKTETSITCICSKLGLVSVILDSENGQVAEEGIVGGRDKVASPEFRSLKSPLQ